MILELWDYLTTPSSKEARQQGYLYKSIALEKRFSRNAKNWQAHIQNCHRNILSCLDRLEKKDVVCILGSGLLVEVPLEQLIKEFNKIVLFDIVHLKSVRRKIKPFTGKIEIVELNFLNPDWLAKVAAYQPSLTVSANLLSQLPDLWIQKQLKERSDWTDQELLSEAQTILKSHLKYLRQLPGEKLLFSDDLRWHESVSGEKTSAVPTLLNIPLPTEQDQWEWTLAPRPEMNPDYDVKMRVKFFHL